MTSFDDLLRDLNDGSHPVPPADQFRPYGWYNPDGDSLEIHLKHGPYLTERIDDVVSVFVDPADQSSPVGVVIKGVKSHVEPTLGPLDRIHLNPERCSLGLILFGMAYVHSMTFKRTPTMDRLVELYSGTELEMRDFLISSP